MLDVRNPTSDSICGIERPRVEKRKLCTRASTRTPLKDTSERKSDSCTLESALERQLSHCRRRTGGEHDSNSTFLELAPQIQNKTTNERNKKRFSKWNQKYQVQKKRFRNEGFLPWVHSVHPCCRIPERMPPTNLKSVKTKHTINIGTSEKDKNKTMTKRVF